MRRALACRHLLTPAGWRSPAVLVIGGDGAIEAVTDAAPPDAAVEPVDGFVIPGMPDLHSHAFQRALAGLAEVLGPDPADTFWSWRERMYALAAALEPDDVEAIAAQVQVEALEGGFTSVGEFHYLHHRPGGAPHPERAELGLRVMAAAEATGIGLTLLPALYQHGGFGRPPAERQRRFVHATVDAWLDLVDDLADEARRHPRFRVGAAAHSLRAVDPASLAALVEATRARDASAPVHLHVAEQTQEVEDSLAHLGARPVRWLLDHAPVDGRWCLVHATHVDDGEVRDLAASGAVVGLCPTTEANLGDGLFPARAFLEAGGAFGVGSDSHVATRAAEELRLLEYGQRLVTRRRNVLASPAHPRTGERLYLGALAGGARALAQPVGALAPGRRADLVTLDPLHPRLEGHGPDTALDALLFGGADGAIDRVMVEGRWVVKHGRHQWREGIEARFARTLARLRDRT